MTSILTVTSSPSPEYDYLVFTVSLSEPASDAVSVDYQFRSGSAQLRDDFYSTDFAGTLTFAPGETVRTIQIRSYGDSLDELDESVFLELSDPRGASFGGNIHTLSATGWVLDEDGVGVNRALAVSSPVVTEAAGGQALFTLSLSEAFTTDRTFSFTTYDGSARAGSDYVARTGTVTFLAGQTEATVAVTLINDGAIEAGESFGLAVTGAHGVPAATGTAGILNEDGAGPVISVEGGRESEYSYLTYTVRLSEPASDAVSVDYQFRSGSAQLRDDFYSTDFAGTLTFAPGETVRTIQIRSYGDSLDELDESVFLELSDPRGASFGGNIHTLSATGWVLDEDGVGVNRALAVSSPVVTEAAGGQALFTLSLSEAFTTDRTFSFTTYDGSARAGSDYVARTGTVTFLAGQTEATVAVTLINDGAIEAGESFGLAVTGAHGVPAATGTAGILNEDGAGPVISVEGGRESEYSYLTYTVRLSEPASDAVSVDYQFRSGSAQLRDDFYSTDFAGTLTFAPGETVRTIQIRSYGDSLDELDESVFLELSDPRGASFGGGNRTLSATGWVLDGDGVGLNRSVAVGNATVQEGPGGRVAVFVVDLSAPSTERIAIDFQTLAGTARAGSDFTARSGEVVFRPGQTQAEIRIPIADDLVLENTESFSLRLVPPFPSQISSATPVPVGVATIIDGSLRGTGGNDRLAGTAYAERIEGLAGNDRLDGRGGNDILGGGGGNDRMIGGDGADVLSGNAGRDTFVFDTRPGGGNVDRITDFNVAADMMLLENEIFRGLSEGALRNAAFASNRSGQATDATDRFIYERDTGALWYDADGTGGVGRVQIATLSPGLSLTAADFLVI
ncbi:Calx-beta domain-containing protein [Rhodobacter sp. CZR27]|uniref:Calx-beta domain-containing protein n=1 Tax=Rhodobacter sp. CZR27 TaxID=2033869 RepID=UPI000BBED729|nr:Calx-beta domain-containing protein [Rhodobacter sp. CZR27]